MTHRRFDHDVGIHDRIDPAFARVEGHGGAGDEGVAARGLAGADEAGAHVAPQRHAEDLGIEIALHPGAGVLLANPLVRAKDRLDSQVEGAAMRTLTITALDRKLQ